MGRLVLNAEVGSLDSSAPVGLEYPTPPLRGLGQATSPSDEGEVALHRWSSLTQAMPGR